MMKKIVFAIPLCIVLFSSCGGNKKDVCTCVKESTKNLIDKGFDIDPDNPEYPEGCEFMKELSQDEIEKQIDDACRDEVLEIIFQDFNMDDPDLGEMDTLSSSN